MNSSTSAPQGSPAWGPGSEVNLRLASGQTEYGYVLGLHASTVYMITPRAYVTHMMHEIVAVTVSPYGSLPETLVRGYFGYNQTVAFGAFEMEARQLGYWGFRPVSQTWIRRQRSVGDFVIAIVLFVVLVGFLVFLYMLIVQPSDGILSVTYARAAPLPQQSVAAPQL